MNSVLDDVMVVAVSVRGGFVVLLASMFVCA